MYIEKETGECNSSSLTCHLDGFLQELVNLLFISKSCIDRALDVFSAQQCV